MHRIRIERDSAFFSQLSEEHKDSSSEVRDLMFQINLHAM
jgi:hypothetical protein